jgi:hypothetical protein
VGANVALIAKPQSIDQEARMTRTIRAFVSRIVRDPNTDDAHVHFHNGAEGHPAACHDPRCPNPRLNT